MEQTTIGWIGLGNMGIPMATQLINAGYQVTLYNRSKNKDTSLKNLGASISASPKDLINSSEFIFIMVSYDKAIDQLFKA